VPGSESGTGVPTDFPTGSGRSQNGNGDETGSNEVGGQGGRSGEQGGNDASGAGGAGQGERTAEAGNPGGGGSGDETGSGDASQAGAGAEGEFDRSLGDFDQIMKSEQDKIARTGGGTAADRIFKQAGQNGGGADGGDEAGGNGGANGSVAQAGGEGEQQQQGGSAGGSSGAQEGGAGAKADVPTDAGPEQTVASVQGCSDQDKVARQLCEAATKEKDPFLRASLWDEYNQYKKILAKQ
jgi:hypothetical protein